VAPDSEMDCAFGEPLLERGQYRRGPEHVTQAARFDYQNSALATRHPRLRLKLARDDAYRTKKVGQQTLAKRAA
jgi:hypothetical protein